ncbi:MAG: hypothetical protein NWR72_04810 [Bacteroidia bacterium]|nr:hypothetical protein [Bacteroidia bacterium]
MKIIFDIVKKLRKPEIRRLRQRIQQAPFDYERVGTLLDLVTREEEKEEEYYSQKLYGKAPDNTFRVTKSRLKRMLENAVIHDKSLNEYSPAVNARLQARKRFLQGEILLGRGAYAASKNLLLQVLASAKKFHLYEEEFQAELLLYRNYSNRSSVLDFSKQTQHLLSLNRVRFLMTQGAILYYGLTNLFAHQTLTDQELVVARGQIDELKAIALETAHPQMLSYHYLSELYYHELSGEDQLALAFGISYRDLVAESPEVSSPQRVAIAEGYLGEIYLRLGDFDKAQVASQKSLEGFTKEQMNYLRGLELAFRISFFSGDLARAEKYIEEARTHNLFHESDEFEGSRHLAARWHYFQSALHFERGNFKEANRELQETSALLSDKKGWNLLVRRLEIMILHEMGHIDLLETKIQNLRQFIKRTQQHESRLRSTLLMKLMMIWYRTEYVAKEALEQGGELIGQLESTTESRYGGESDLIPIDLWLRKKAAEG